MIYDKYAYLAGPSGSDFIFLSASAVGITEDGSESAKVTIKPEGQSADIDFYPWGTDNKMPNNLISNAFKNNVVASNLDFNSKIGYGDDIIPVRRSLDQNNEVKYTPLFRAEAPEIFEFLEDNNFPHIQAELVHDLSLLNNGFIELIMNKAKTKIVQIRHKEASNSRLQVMDENGIIQHHGYCADWSDTSQNKVFATPLLDFASPLYDLKVRLGKKADANGKRKKSNDSRYIVHIAPPSPGRFYYQKAYWWSIFESHWFDFSCAIPEFKMNLMKNQMVLKYHIQIRRGFFDDLFKAEGLTAKEEQVARKKQFFTEMEDFLSGKENAGKNLVSEVSYDAINRGVEVNDIKITAIDSFIKGGEYIEDSEEASNAICYAMGVHPSLQGASPGKGKTINGTEARELFIIKQSLMASVRKLLLLPLEIVKSINNWPEDIDFIIPNIMLTTLDKNTGAQKQIGNQIQ